MAQGAVGKRRRQQAQVANENVRKRRNQIYLLSDSLHNYRAQIAISRRRAARDSFLFIFCSVSLNLRLRRDDMAVEIHF